MVKKKTEKDRKALENKLDTVFSQYIRLLRSDINWYCNCISCGVRLFYKKMHNCHYIPRASRKYRWDEDNCRPWCAGCNTYRENFHYAKFTIYLSELFWQERVKERRNDRNKVHKIQLRELEEKIVYYKEKVKQLLEDKDINSGETEHQKYLSEIIETVDE